MILLAKMQMANSWHVQCKTAWLDPKTTLLLNLSRICSPHTNGQKRYSEVHREYNIAESILSRWLSEYRERGKSAFLPKEPLTKEYLEKKRAWDRSYYQRHKIKRQAANYERRARLYEYLQQIKAKARCGYCGENHPATLQFHHRDPSQKEFNVSEFVTRQLGGIDKLKKEIEKCDVVCANCHLKYHYNHDRRQARITSESVAIQFESAEQELIPTQDEEMATPSPITISLKVLILTT